jgi:hypothetical protein
MVNIGVLARSAGRMGGTTHQGEGRFSGLVPMASRSRRTRSTGRFAPGETFGAIPSEVLNSVAYRALPDFAVRVLIALAAQYRGVNNGDLSLTREQAASLGVAAGWKVSAGLELLVLTGLVLRTRQGKARHGRGICALYALAWRPIDPTPHAYPPINGRRTAPNGWALWAKPENWSAIERSVRRRAKGSRSNNLTTISDQPPRVEQVQPPRVEQSNAPNTRKRPTRVDRSNRSIRPPRVGGLLDIGSGTELNGTRCAASK